MPSTEHNGETTDGADVVPDAGELKVKFRPVPKTLVSPFTELFPGCSGNGLVRGEPGGFVFSSEYGRHAQKIYEFKPRKDDVWLMSFPRSGTTWTQEMIWMIMNNCDTVKAAKTPLFDRCPYLEYEFETSINKYPPELRESIKLDVRQRMAPPRILQTHLPFYLLHPSLLDTAKVIYVARNPKDVIVSYYFLYKLYKVVHDYQGDLELFAEYVMNDEVFYAPYFPHVLDAWSKRHHPNMLFLFYEDRKKNLRGEIDKISAFLNKELSDGQVSLLSQHLRFDAFAKNQSVNWESGKKTGILHNTNDMHFIRKGKTGDWKNHLNPNLNKRIDEWINRNLRDTDLKFVTELESQD